MLFSSISFIYYFLPFVLILYFIVPKKIKNLVLFISSMVFYFYGEAMYTFIMLGAIFITYISGLLMAKFENTKYKKIFCIFSIISSLGLLVLFKYIDFFIVNINNLFGLNIVLLKLIMPIGISFYVFQLISYIIDIYKGTAKVQKSFLKLATYVSLFPQLIAGPIVRYETIEKELEERNSTIEDISYGIFRFIIGLSKKILIANILGELCNKFFETTEKSIVFYWIYGISYSLQIYFDFSAYSDMAIGLGRIFGFHFLENFNYPYISKSITEFWRRWHISLGSWFRDYVYIPLGGNRKGKVKLLRNIFIVWFLTGFWHGANWNFIVWGLIFGIILTIEKLFLNNIIKKLPSILQRVYVLFIVMISFIIFDSENIRQAIFNIIGLFGANGENFINQETIYYLKSYCIVLIIAIIGATPTVKIVIEKLKLNRQISKVINLFEPLVLMALLIIITAYLVDNSYNPFLYFRF